MSLNFQAPGGKFTDTLGSQWPPQAGAPEQLSGSRPRVRVSLQAARRPELGTRLWECRVPWGAACFQPDARSPLPAW